jgi:hypothetical protein
MRTSIAILIVVLVTLLAPVATLARQRTLDVDTKAIQFDTITAPGDTYSGAIRITNISDAPVHLDFDISLSKPRDWSELFSPFIVEDAGITPSWDPCDPLPAGATCIVYLTFQTDRAGTFAGSFWINDTYRVKLRGLAT